MAPFVPLAGRVGEPDTSAVVVTGTVALLGASRSSQGGLEVNRLCCGCTVIVDGSVTRYVLTTPPAPTVNRAGGPSLLISAACRARAGLVFRPLGAMGQG